MMPDQPKTSRDWPPGGADGVTTGDICVPGLADHIEKLGPVLVNCLHSAIKTLQIYDSNNRASQTVLARLQQIINDLADVEERVTLAVSTELLLINEVRIIVDTQCLGPLLYLIDEMKKRNIEEIDFEPDVSTKELGSFVQLFGLEPDSEDAFGELSRTLTDAGVKGVRLTEAIERVKYLRDARVGRQEIREESNRAMSRAILFMGEVIRSIEHRRPIQMPKAHRLTQQISDIIRKDETVLLGLASIKDYDEYTFSHSVNVSVLSMLIAERMGLPKNDVSQIGVAALFHDIGKTHVPRSVLNKPGTLTTDEWMLMERHSMLGVIELSRVRSLRSIVDPIFVALQHHLLYNGAGYPKKPGGWALHPYIHIVTVADVFDAMTTPRIYRTESLTPDRALCFILERSGELFDPLVVKVFIKAIGVYPVGTVVQLDSGEIATVVRQNTETRLMHRPVVTPLLEDGPGDEIDLAQLGDDGRTYRHTIANSLLDKSFETRKAACFISK